MMYEQPTILAFAALLIIATSADWYTTIDALRYPFTSEANRVLNFTIMELGVVMGVGWSKLLQIAVVIGYVQYFPQTGGAWLPAILTLPFAFIAVRNYNVAQKRKDQGFTRGSLKDAQDRAIAKAAGVTKTPEAASRKTAASFSSPRSFEVSELSVW